MTIAEIHGKISSNASNLDERREDQLTGNVFGAMRYISPDRLLWPFLKKAYFRGARNILLDNPQLEDVRFWPWLNGVEPDVLIILSESALRKTVIVIEIKLDSGLSGEDQLLREMMALSACYKGMRQILIYLTAEVAYPREIMTETRKKSNEKGLGSVELYWLSWNDLPTIIDTKIDEQRLAKNTPEWFILNDMKNLLDRKGFARFSSINFPKTAAPLPFWSYFSRTHVKPDDRRYLYFHLFSDVPRVLSRQFHFLGG